MKKNNTNGTNTTKVNATATTEISKMKKTDLIAELKQRMGDKFTPDMEKSSVSDMREVLAALRQGKTVPVEAKVETAKKTAKVEKAVKKVKAKATTAAEQTAEEPKKVVKSKTTTPKEDTSVENTAEAENKNSLPTAKMFRGEFEYKGLSFKAAEDLKSYGDVKKAFDEDEENLYITAYWTAQHIAQFDYKGNFNLKGKVPKKFEGDVDILEIVYVSQKSGEDYFLAVSLITGADYKFYGDTVEYYEDEKAGYKVRYSNTMEYEIYRAVE